MKNNTITPMHEAFLEVGADYLFGLIERDQVVAHMVAKSNCTKEEAEKFLKEMDRGDR